MGDIAVGSGRTVQVHIAHMMAVVAIHRPADIPSVQGIEGHVERHSSVGAPVAVDILRPADAPTCRLVVGHHIPDGVAGGLETSVGAETPVALRLGDGDSHAVGDKGGAALHLEIDVQVRRERRFQSRVTHGDGERVGVVVDIEQLRDGRLRGGPPEPHLQVGLLIEPVAQVERGREVGHRPHRVDRHTQVLLDEVRPLWLHRDADVHIVFLAYEAQLHVGIMPVLRTLGVSAQVPREVILVRIVEKSEQAGPVAVFAQHDVELVIGIVGEVVGQRVAFLVAVVVTVAQLQEDALDAPCSSSAPVALHRHGPLVIVVVGLHLFSMEHIKRFGIGESERVVEIVVGRRGVAVGLIGGVVTPLVGHLIEFHHRQVGILVVSVAVTDIGREGHVAPVSAHSPDELQLRREVFAAAITHRLVLTAIDHDALSVHRLEARLVERVGIQLEGTDVERGRVGESPAVVGREIDVGTERQRGGRVDGPLQVHVSRPAVCPGIILADAAREGPATGIDKTLRPRAVPVVGIVVIPCHAPAHPEVLAILVTHVERRRLGVALSAAIATAPAATAREIAVVHIVGIAHEGVAHVAERFHSRQTHAIAVVGAIAQVGVHLESLSRTFLRDELQHEVVVAVVDARLP